MLAAIFLLSFVLAGCQSGGIAQESYDELKELYEDLRAKYQEVTSKPVEVQPEIPDLSDELAAAQAQIDELQAEIDELSDRYIIEGATPAETAEKIVRYYHDTHVYDAYDLFVCADMAAEVWNMLKAQGIDALIAVGDIHNPISNIVQCNHSWVLAEVAPGEYLELETTGGRVVLESENPLYYRGWTFDTPAEEKEYQRLVREYNTMVGIRNDVADEVNEAAEYYNQASNQVEADQRMAVYEKLKEVLESMETQLLDIKAEIDGLATKCGG